MLGGNFGAAPNPPRAWSYWRASSGTAAARSSGLGGPSASAARVFPEAADATEHVRRLGTDVVRPFAPHVGDGGQHLAEPWQLAAPSRREVGARVEGLAGRGEEDGHGPTAVTGHGRDGVHVHRVDVGALLAVDLDGDVPRVHQLGDGGVLERLVGHDVAPVAGRVAHGEEHRNLAPLRLGERLRAPGPPVDGVLGVLLQVRAGGLREAVGHRLILAAPTCRLGTIAPRRRFTCCAGAPMPEDEVRATSCWTLPA